MRRAKIVCTLGPATSSPDQLRALVEAGMDVARFNLSHGDLADHVMTFAEEDPEGFGLSIAFGAAMIINFFMASEMFSWIITYAVVIVFPILVMTETKRKRGVRE